VPLARSFGLCLSLPPPRVSSGDGAAIFWGAIALVVYVYRLPCLIFLPRSPAPRPVAKAPVLPTVSFIIAAYNESG